MLRGLGVETVSSSKIIIRRLVEIRRHDILLFSNRLHIFCFFYFGWCLCSFFVLEYLKYWLMTLMILYLGLCESSGICLFGCKMVQCLVFLRTQISLVNGY